jgi:hypothetical protein
MKTNLFYLSKNLLYLSLAALIFTSCSNDDDGNDLPAPVNEEEVITTMTISLQPSTGGAPVILEIRDLDGPDGPNAPVITVSDDLVFGRSYSGSIVLLNETVNPPDNITTEVEEEANEHQFFFVIGGNLDATVDYENFDGNGNPLGTQFTLNTQGPSNGNLTVVLRHEPKKPNDGTLADAGGETDISATFPINIVL